MLQILIEASYYTSKVVLIAAGLAIFWGMGLGIFLEITNNPYFLGEKYRFIHKIFNAWVNFLCNIPELLLLITLVIILNNIFVEYLSLPLSVAIAIGIIGAVSLGKQLFICFSNIPRELTETAKFLGANHLQIITKFLIPQILPQIIQSVVSLFIQLINLSVFAGILGIDSLGKVALEQGLQAAELTYLLMIILFVMVLIYIVKFVGYMLKNFIETKYYSNLPS